MLVYFFHKFNLLCEKRSASIPFSVCGRCAHLCHSPELVACVLMISASVIHWVCVDKLAYSRYFSGGKSFVSSGFLVSLWKYFHGRGILRVRTPNYVVLFRG